MPNKFGSVKRVRAIRDVNSLRNNLNLYVVSENSNGNLVQSGDVLKNNIKNWILPRKMITDTVDILDAYIVNIGIEFIVVSKSNISKYQTLSNCYSRLRDKLLVTPEIGEPFMITDIYNFLKEAEGVLDVVKVDIVQKKGGLYSDTSYNLRKNTSPDGTMITFPRNVIWELKYVDADINGAVR